MSMGLNATRKTDLPARRGAPSAGQVEPVSPFSPSNLDKPFRPPPKRYELIQDGSRLPASERKPLDVEETIAAR